MSYLATASITLWRERTAASMFISITAIRPPGGIAFRPLSARRGSAC
jgi:hypothetical protein